MNKKGNSLEIDEPSSNKFTLYSKSGCINCRKAKDVLGSKNVDYSIINCDEYLVENRKQFLKMIMEIANQEIKSFPIIFNNDKQFIGGYDELVDYLNKNLTFDNDF
jgi:glutaredoxin